MLTMINTKPAIKIDFVSDIACPWCAIGLGNLGMAIASIHSRAQCEVHFRAFELNPQMPKGGQEVIEHLTQKYQTSAEQVKENQRRIREKAIAAGFEFHPEGRKWVYNTFDAHRLLFWAAEEVGLEKQSILKTELFKTYFCLAVDLDDQQNLLEAVIRAGLDPIRAKQVLESSEFAQEVRQEEQRYQQLGIHSVPSMIINDQYLVQGAQPPDVFLDIFEKLLEQAV
jgi:predicted DsbA family dithiol-disulfide isomerase